MEFCLQCILLYATLKWTIYHWHISIYLYIAIDFPGGTVDKQCLSVQEMQDVGLIPTLERSSGVANGNPLQYSCLENSMDRGA